MFDFPGKRIRDPVHGLIVFQAGKEDSRDTLAWQLLQTPEMQRLRRIRQLGVSEFVYPGATHSRFAHSIGVFHCAKQLVEIIRREIGKEFDSKKADDAVLAALLHDIGHGPFSHAFERAQKARGIKKKHEKWTAEIIRNPDGNICQILGKDRAERIAAMLEAEDPADIYHAVFSSSFDADRLDYIQRDRMMTGTQAGHIDFDWLMDNLRVREIELSPDEGDGQKRVPTFCFHTKAIAAAEQFLLARYTLHEQVYFHKTTRAMEVVVMRLFRRLAELATIPDKTGLSPEHPLLRFLAADEPGVQEYLALDDMVVYAALDSLCQAEDAILREMATRLRERKPFKPLCVLTEYGSDPGRQKSAIRAIEKRHGEELDDTYGGVIKDMVELSIYTTVGEDDEKAFKKVHVLDGRDRLREIADVNVSRMIWSLADKPKTFIRYYFADEADRQAVLQGK